MSQRLTDDERAQAIALYGTGLTLTQVGDRIGRSTYAVRCILVDAGVPRRSANLPTITERERAEVIRLYTVDRLSTYDIANRLDRSQSAVWQILVDEEVPRRPAGWPKDASTRRRDRAGVS
jgi:DNA-directed RNA polymerase specialized sigma24 family protein